MSLTQVVRSNALVLVDPLGLFFDGGTTVVIGGTIVGGSTLVTTTGTAGAVGVTSTVGTTATIFTTTTTTSTLVMTSTGGTAVGVGGTAAGIAGTAAASPVIVFVGGVVVIEGVSCGVYSVADPIWEWLFWDPNLEGDPSKSTGPQPTCGPIGGTQSTGIKDPSKPLESRGRSWCSQNHPLLQVCNPAFYGSFPFLNSNSACDFVEPGSKKGGNIPTD